MIRLAIAEDHQSLIDGIRLLLKYEDDIEIVGTANDGEALLKIVRLKRPNVVITDIRMPKIDGIVVTKTIKKELPHTKVLGFTMFHQPEAIEQMIDAGADGYLLKNSPLEDVLKAIKTVYNGEPFYDANISLRSLATNHSSKKGQLTKRQREILNLVGQGKTSQEIADALFIGVRTVETHRKNMIRILNLSGKGALMRYALDQKYNF